MTAHRLPPRLAEELRRDPRPVRPLPPAGVAALAVAAAALAVQAAIVATVALRPDLARLGVWVAWGASGVQVALGLALVYAALREAIPAAALPAGPRWALLGAGLLAHCATAVATWWRSPGPPPAVQMGTVCFRHELLLALPAFALTVALVARALPLRPSVAGLLGGAGSALLADAVQHLLCPFSDLRHVLLWHTGALLALMAAGWGLGRLWEWRLVRRALGRREG